MTDIFQTYSKDTGNPLIGAGSGFVDIPTTYESGLLHEVEKPFTPFIINSTKFHDTKHPIIQSTSGIVSGLSGYGKPTDIYIEQIPDFVKSFNKDMMSNYMLDLQQNTYSDGTKLGYLDPKQVHSHSAVIGIHSQEKKPLIESLDYLNIYRPHASIDRDSRGSASELIPMYEEIGLVTGRIPITGVIDESYQKTVDDFRVEPEDTFREALRVDKERSDDMNKMLEQIASIKPKAPTKPDVEEKIDSIPSPTQSELMMLKKDDLGAIIENYNKANGTNFKYKSKTKAERIELILEKL